MSEAHGVPAGGSGLSGDREAQHHTSLQDYGEWGWGGGGVGRRIARKEHS